ncbi:MAG: ABC transporter permease [Chloroflexi bacterium]|nr:ABC transporter permease [Chloroflexota bacterium]
MLAVMGLGVLVAATLLASAPIYARTMADLGLTFVIREDLSTSAGSRIEVPQVPLQTSEGKAIQQAVQRRIDERLGWFRASQQKAILMGRYWIVKPGQDVSPSNSIVGRPQAIPGYESRVRVLDGRLPVKTDRGTPMEVVMSARGAQVAGVKVGDAFDFREAYDSCERELPKEDPPPPPPPCNATATLRFSFPAVLVGIVEVLDPKEAFWPSPPEQYFEPYRLQIADAGIVVPVLTDDQELVQTFGSQYPAYTASLTWNVLADPTKLTRTNYKRAKSDIEEMYSELEGLRVFATSPLRDTLNRFGRSADYQQTPLAILLLEITGIALFYVGIVAAIVVERQAAEISLLRSRGASLMQIATIYLFQGLLLGLPAMLIAPFLAAGVTAGLGLAPGFRDVNNGSLLPVTIPPLAFVTAAIGAALSLVALLLPAVFVALRSATAVRRSESRPGASLLQRYYLDLVLAGLALLLLVELRQRGSVFTPSATGGVSSDPLLLASPALTIAAGGALVLRFYPLFLRMVARVTRSFTGTSTALGLTQVVRNSGQYTRLTLLLMMAVAVGTFAASYASTTGRSYRERAFFESGADFRATASAPFTGGATPADLEATMKKIDGVERVSASVRQTGAVASAGQLGADFQLLAVDPAAARDMLWFRDDFADVSLRELMGEIAAPPIVPGRPIPGEPATISVWARGDDSLAAVTVWARVRDAKGIYALIELGPGDTGGAWKQYTAPAAGKYGPALVMPLTLVSILTTEPSNRFSTQYRPLSLDDITVADAAGATSVVDDFESGSGWAAFPTRGNGQDTFAVTADSPHGGKASGTLAFRVGSSEGTRGIYATTQPLPLPVVVSTSFLEATGLAVGSGTLVKAQSDALIPIVIRGTFDLFPTTPADDGPAVIINRDQAIAWSETASFSGSNTFEPNELLFTLTPRADRTALEELLRNRPYEAHDIVDRQAAVRSNAQNPLIAAGGSGILFVAFAAVLLLVGAALLTSLLTSVRRRRVEFAVARALGLTRLQVFRMLALEYAIVGVAGVVTGAVLGLVVGRQMLSFLEVTETGGKVEPSFILETQWGVVGASVGMVGVVFFGALLLATRYLARTSDAQALRTE